MERASTSRFEIIGEGYYCLIVRDNETKKVYRLGSSPPDPSIEDEEKFIKLINNLNKDCNQLYNMLETMKMGL